MTQVKRLGLLVVAVVSFFALTYSVLGAMPAEQALPPRVERPTIDDLLRFAQENGTVPIIAGFDISGGYDPALFASEDTRAGNKQTAAIHQAQADLLARHSGHQFEAITRYDYIPYIALHVDEAGLRALQADPAVTSIVEDSLLRPDLSSSIPLMRANLAHNLNYRGAGTAVAILDTGVDRNHPDLVGKVVSEACYSVNNGASGFFSACPNGQETQIGNGAATPPSHLITAFDHGTHVAATAAGVAPDAKIVAIQVFSRVYETAAKQCTTYGDRSPCLRSSQSSYIKALERVLAIRATYNIVAANMSLGSGSYVSICDLSPQFTSVKLVVDLLRNSGTLTVASAGNSGYRNSIGAPACISSTVSVGATSTYPTYAVDKVADFSNMASYMTVLAPGTPILAAVPGSAVDCGIGNSPINGRCYKGGTSMAAPHVAGAIAVLRSAKSTATVPQIMTALTSNGPLVTDHRSGGFVTKRRLDVFDAVCSLVNCDQDDARTMTLNSPLTGQISAGDPDDIYYFNGIGGQRVNIYMNRTSGTLDPFLVIYDADNNLLAFNDNGGGGTNARINPFILPRTGQYRIIAYKTNSTQTGAYTIGVSQGSYTQNPMPFALDTKPNKVTVNSAGFWAQVHGSNFMPSSIARLNGVNRPTSFYSNQMIWIWLYPSDLTSVGYKTIEVYNPGPGGGVSNPTGISVTSAFNGESHLLAPEEPFTSVGQPTEFAVDWIHPTDSWRNMQNMDIRLANDALGGPLWLRLTEGNPESTLYLLNSAGVPLYSGTLVSGQFGADEDWVITDTLTLHFGETKFFGSGQVIVITPTITFGPEAVGTYDIRFAVDDDEEDSQIQNADVLGRFTVLPQGCTVPVAAATIEGQLQATTGVATNYTAVLDPPNASTPLTYTWFPEPAGGQGTASATYQWSDAGQQPVGVLVEGCSDVVSDIVTVAVSTTANPDLSLSKTAPAVAMPGEPITVSLTISNGGSIAASNVTINDVLPTGASYVSGGTLDGNTVRWTLPELAGFGATEEFLFLMTATETITNSDYSATANGGYSATGNPAAVTRIVDALTTATPLNDAEIAYDGAGVSTDILFPAGSVFDKTIIAYEELDAPSRQLPSGIPFAGRAFRLLGYQANALVPALEPGEPFSIELTYLDGDVGGLEESQLRLYRWNGTNWLSQGIDCQPQPNQGRVTCAVFAPLGEYALVMGGQETSLYLPTVIR